MRGTLLVVSIVFGLGLGGLAGANEQAARQGKLSPIQRSTRVMREQHEGQVYLYDKVKRARITGPITGFKPLEKTHLATFLMGPKRMVIDLRDATNVPRAREEDGGPFGGNRFSVLKLPIGIGAEDVLEFLQVNGRGLKAHFDLANGRIVGGTDVRHLSFGVRPQLPDDEPEAEALPADDDED